MGRNRVSGVVVAGVAALLVVVGSLMPWISLSTPVGSIGFSGTNLHLNGSGVDGTVTLVLGLVAGACFGFSLLRADRVLPAAGLLVACATAAIAVYDLVDLGSKVAQAQSTPLASVSIGYGLWITALAAIGMLVGSFMTVSTPSDGPRMDRSAVRRIGQPVRQPESQEYWVADPFGRHELRWWSDNRYTDRVMDDGVEGADAPGRRTATTPPPTPATD